MVRARWSLLVVAACGAPPAPRSVAPPAIARDPHSHAEPERVAVRHLALDLTVDFAHRQLRGVARLALDRKDRAAPLRLDVDGPTIEAVTDCDGHRAPYRLGPAEPVIGRALEIDLGAADCVAITYATGPDARALLWVDPAGTTSGAQPMLFTESESIHARTWIPIQDTPSVRFTYDATIHVPTGVRPVMSAENPAAPAADGSWHFRMAQPIPSYLVALAVGELAFRPIGPRTGVYAEPAVVDAAAYEFAEVEQMIATAERLYGPYRWGRYDMLVLPPSFPFGGMENPRLTFLTPTAITGDRALVGLIAHELAHSWSGNLVTNATWSDFWLNEGCTSYVELRIMEALRGAPATEVSWYLGRKDLDEAFAKTAPADTRLALAIPASRDPDAVPSDAAYQKGALLLRALERGFGRPAFDRFLRGWFDRHAFQPVTTAMFEAAAVAELLPTRPGAMTADALRSWLHDPGLPATAPAASAARVTELAAAAAAFATGGSPPEPTGWTTTDWVVFLRALPPAISADRLRALDARFALTTTHNAEIAMYWLPLRVRAGDHGADAAVEAFLIRVGRRRMIEPLYQAMVAADASWRELAGRVYARARARYHPIVRAALDKLMPPGTIYPR